MALGSIFEISQQNFIPFQHTFIKLFQCLDKVEKVIYKGYQVESILQIPGHVDSETSKARMSKKGGVVDNYFRS
jgi:hypothetical protein